MLKQQTDIVTIQVASTDEFTLPFQPASLGLFLSCVFFVSRPAEHFEAKQILLLWKKTYRGRCGHISELHCSLCTRGFIFLIYNIMFLLGLQWRSTRTKASSVARSLKLGKSTSVSTWMGDHLERPSTLNLSPFVGEDFNLWLVIYTAIIEATVVKWTNT